MDHPPAAPHPADVGLAPPPVSTTPVAVPAPVARRRALPVLDEVPELAAALTDLRAADRATARAVDLLVRLRTSGTVETATGVDVDTWLALVARTVRSDRRVLRTVVDTLSRLPGLRAAFVDGRLNWGQVRRLVLQLRDARVRLDATTDRELLTTLEAAGPDRDPDGLDGELRWTVWQLAPDASERALTDVTERLLLQPRLDGTGGSVVGELGATGFAALETVTRPEAGCPDRPARRAARLTDLCLEVRDGDRTSSDPTTDGPSSPGAPDRPRRNVRVVLRADLETLLGLTSGPSQLLTGLAGGAVHVDAATARDLAEHASDLRLVITADGAPVGVGRRSRSAPGWLRDALLAGHTTCTHPGCPQPALTADVDHARPWADGGSTDVANLAPLCAHHNRAPERRRWQVRQTRDGRRRWAHRRTGLSATTAPDVPPPRRRRTADAPGRRSLPASRSDAARRSAPPPRPPHPAGPGATRRRPPAASAEVPRRGPP